MWVVLGMVFPLDSHMNTFLVGDRVAAVNLGSGYRCLLVFPEVWWEGLAPTRVGIVFYCLATSFTLVLPKT